MPRRVKGEGSVYQRESDGRWIGVVDLGWVGGKRVRKTVSAATLQELRPKFRRLKTQVEAGVLTDDSTVAQWLTHWLEEIAPGRVRPRTLQGYQGYVRTWLIPHLGKHRLDRLKPEHVRALHRAMEDAGKSPATRRQAHAILQRALKVAEREGKVSRNVATLVDAPETGKAHYDYLTAIESARVLQAATDADRARLVVALLMGLRQGEALALRWEDADLDVGVAHVHRSLARIAGRGLVEGPVKSSASVRFVPMVPAVVEIMEEWRLVTGGQGLVFGGDSPVNPRRDWQCWKDALSRAGVKDVPLHGARASCASLLREIGYSERVIADILGHAQVSTTQAHYIRSDDRQRREAMESAAAALLGSGPPAIGA